jgi:uncharacterized protein (DUF4415 family)
MKDVPTGKAYATEPHTDWERLQRLTPADIRAGLETDPDAHPTDAAFWETAQVIMPRRKSTITLRLDADVLDWLKQHGRGYQTRINAILRAYMESHPPKA